MSRVTDEMVQAGLDAKLPWDDASPEDTMRAIIEAALSASTTTQPMATDDERRLKIFAYRMAGTLGLLEEVAERVDPTMCPTVSFHDDGPRERVEGRISAIDWDNLKASVRGVLANPEGVDGI